MIFIKSYFEYKIKNDLSVSNRKAETLAIEIKQKMLLILQFFFCYWPQNTDSKIFISHLNNILQKVSYKNKKCFVVGDFNMECLKIFSTTTFP